MSVERYAARRHQLVIAAAQRNARTVDTRRIAAQRIAQGGAAQARTVAEDVEIFWETQRLTAGRRSPQAEFLELTRERERRDRVAPRSAATKPAATNATQQADRLRRLARAQTALGPAPKPRALRPVYEACSSAAMGGGLMFDPIGIVYAVNGAAPATSGASKRMNVQATQQQRLQRLARAEADMRR
jgi:hypothetical protein